MNRPLCLTLGLAALAWSCGTPPPVHPKAVPVETPAPAPDNADDAPAVQGAAGGSGEDNMTPSQLTGVPGIDRAQELEVRILDARGTGRVGGTPIAAGRVGLVPTGAWMLTDEGSEYEITLRSSLVGEGIIRLSRAAAFLVEPSVPGEAPRFRLFGGSCSFYLPHLSLGETTVLTPAGPLVTRGAVFTVTVSPDSQVLVTCREGSVYLTGTQNAAAIPGQVVVADRLGRNRVYPMTPSEAMVFTDRWFTVMSDEAAPVVAAALPRKLAAWKALDFRIAPEEARNLALWFRQARTVLGSSAPGPETWAAALSGQVASSPWKLPPPAPGLLGEQP